MRLMIRHQLAMIPDMLYPKFIMSISRKEMMRGQDCQVIILRRMLFFHRGQAIHAKF
jgi:hypothetical protein